MSDDEGPVRRRRIVGPLVATLLLLLGASFFPGPGYAVEVIQPGEPLVFHCILHEEGLVAPGVGVPVSVVERITGTTPSGSSETPNS